MRGNWLIFSLLGLIMASAACGDDGDTTAPDTVIDTAPPALGNQSQVEIFFSALGNANTFHCRVDSGEPTTCQSPFTTTLADGAHTFEVAAALNLAVDETPASAAFSIDSVDPNTELLTAPPTLDGSPTPQFTFQGSDDSGTVTFECSLDGAAFATCVSPAVLSIADGTHQFRMRAKDPAGNVDETPATHGWTVDTSTPDTAITLGPADASTSAAAGTFEFNSPIGSVTFECSFDGATFAACTSPVPFTLADGNHTFAVRAVGIGGPDPTPAARAWIVDAVAPDVTITSAPGDPSNLAVPSFAFSSSDGTATFACRVDGGTFATCTSPFSPAALADGGHTFEVRATDGVGNNTSTSFAWSVDTAAPSVTIVTAPPAATNVNVPSVTFTTAGTPVAVECAVDASAFAPCISPFTVASPLGDGPHAIVVRATDAAGNAGTATAAFEVDTVAPIPTITSAPSLTNDSTPTIDFTVAGATVVECRIDTGVFAACAAPFTLPPLADGPHTFELRGRDAATNSATVGATFQVDTVAPTVTLTATPAAVSSDTTPTVVFVTAGTPTDVTCTVDSSAPLICTSPFTSAALPDGMHTITVRVVDAAGNTSAAVTTFEVDTVAPTVVITDAPPAITPDNTPAVAFITAGSPTTTTCQLDAAAPIPCASPFAPGTLADGPHTVLIRVTDAAANTSTATASFTVDATNPPVLITNQPPALTNDNTPTVEFEVTGAPIAVECRVDGGAFVACTSPFTSGTLADGAHTIVVQATDAAGNKDSDSAAFTVDATPPTVTINSEPLALSNDVTPTVTFTTGGAPTSTQCQVDNGTLVTCTSPFSPSVLDGDHTITVRVADAAGNVTTATSNTFTVDATPPTVVITAQPVALSNDNSPTVSFTTAGSPTAIDCRVDAGAFAACTSPFNPTVTDGTHTITVRVTDAAGNTGSDVTTSFTVDTDPPTVTLGTPPAALSNDNTPTLTFTATGATTVQCRVDAGAFVSCTSPFTSTAIADGSHTITVRVADNAGNSNTATTAAFQVDTQAPVITLNSVPLALSNDDTPSVAFTVTGSPTVIDCRVDAGTFAPCTSPFSPSVSDGTHTLTVRATDAATNASTKTTANFVVDTVAPTVVINTQPAALSNDNTPTVTFTTGGSPTVVQCRVDGGAPVNGCTSPFTAGPLADGSHVIEIHVVDGASNNDTVQTNTFVIDTSPPTVVIDTEPLANSPDNTPTVTFTIGGAPTAIDCRVDTGTFVACTSPFTPAGTVADGTHTITVRVTDGANNTAQDVTASFIIDTAPPTVSITTQPLAESSDNTPTVIFSTTGATLTECQLDAGAFTTCTAPFTPAGTVADGTHTITVRATDGAGNTASATTDPFVIDTVAPSLAIATQPLALSNDSTPTITFTVSGQDTLECRLDAAAFEPCTTGTSFTTTVDDGTHTMTVRASDDAGNVTTVTSNLFTVDTEAPEVTIDSDPPPANDNTPTFSFTVNGASSVSCTIDGTTVVLPCTSPFTTSALADGSHEIVVTASDGAGNTAQDSESFSIDTTPPTIAITGGPLGPTGVDQTEITFSASADASTIECQVDGGSFAACTSPFTPTGLSAATTHTITVRVRDDATNQATAAISFDVDPMVLCLGGTNAADGDVTGTVETLTNATVELWFRSRQSAADFTLFDVSAATPEARHVALAFEAATGSLLLTVDNGVTPSVRTFVIPPSTSIDDWHHYAVVFTGTEQKLFLDGAPIAGAGGVEATTFATAFAGATGATTLALGAAPIEGGFLDLKFSSVARFSAAFTPEYPAVDDAQAVMLFPLDEGSGLTSDDIVEGKVLSWVSDTWDDQCFAPQ